MTSAEPTGPDPVLHESVERTADDFALSIDSVAVAADLHAFLARCATAGPLEVPSSELDLFWHAFILDTHSYAAYCERHFGRFIHHVPPPRVCLQQSRCKSCTGDPEPELLMNELVSAGRSRCSNCSSCKGD